MVNCTDCDIVRFLTGKAVDVYVSASQQWLLEKIYNLTKKDFKDINELPNLLALKRVDFLSFINWLYKNPEFTEAEKKIIYILPLPEGEELKPQHFFSARRLSEWYELIYATDLFYVIKNRSIKTFFQPIFTADKLDLYGFEALSRGISESGKLIPPVELFRKAKILNLQFSLDRLTREKAIENAKSQKVDKYRIFINFTPTSIYNPKECLSTTVALANMLNLDPNNLVFEVVESEKVDDLVHLASILNYYRSKGFRTALDDFGEGYSSLKMLEALSPDYIKIDMHFVRNIHKESFKRTIVNSIVSTAKSMGISTIAEGIETKEEYLTVVELGVDFVQGYLFAKPTESVDIQAYNLTTVNLRPS